MFFDIILVKKRDDYNETYYTGTDYIHFIVGSIEINIDISGNFILTNGKTNSYIRELEGSYSYLSWNGNNLAYSSSSSKRYKHGINVLKDESLNPHKLLELKPVQFIYNEDAKLQYKDMKDQLLPGFIAEEVAEIYPSAVIHNTETGEIESWDERRIIPGMLALIQEQHEKIEEQTEQIKSLENDVVLPNGFDDSFVPTPSAKFARKRRAARRKLLNVACALLGEQFDDDTLIVSTSGRYEFRNKGIDVFLEAMNRLLRTRELKKKVVAFIEVPGWVGEPRKDLQQRLREVETTGACASSGPLEVPQITHWLHNMSHDNVLGMMKYYDMHNRPEDNVKVIFLPCYLDGKDGIINMSYYDVVLGNDLCIYPSYYEPWGYTPLEAVAFHVPCITTDLAGFGLWANGVFGHDCELEDGVKVIHRTDYNYSEVADNIKDTVARFSGFSKKQIDECRKHAGALSKKALWSEFIHYYYEAYDIALRKAEQRATIPFNPLS